LFNPFLQVDTTRNRNIKGSGLGLSISMNLAKLMGGRIELESVYGRGSVFKVRLPLVEGDPTRVLNRDAGDREGIRQGARVLVVDDNEINLRVARGLMGIFGLECDTAASGWEAVEKACSIRYDLVFMDHMMPEMDGVEATRRIRSKGGLLKTVPIVAFTANSVTGVQGMLMDAGMDDFLPKPIRKEALLKVLRRWLPSEEAPGTPADPEGEGEIESVSAEGRGADDGNRAR
jgi:CheY-like chemotaxis protein